MENKLKNITVAVVEFVFVLIVSLGVAGSCGMKVKSHEGANVTSKACK